MCQLEAATSRLSTLQAQTPNPLDKFLSIDQGCAIAEVVGTYKMRYQVNRMTRFN